MRLGSLITLAAVAAGCATVESPTPGFQVSRPIALTEQKSIAIIGDLQMTPWFVRATMRRESNGGSQQRLLEDLRAHVDELAALVILGDLVFTAKSARDWRHFDTLVTPIARRVPVLPAIGNHDYYCMLVRNCRQNEIPQHFLDRFPWFAPGQPYVVPYGEVALVFIDSETAIEAQGAWLREWARAHAHEHTWVLVLMHRPPHTDSLLPGVAPDVELQRHIVGALDGSPLVPVFIAGHAHGYEHLVVDGVRFIISAGGGGPRGELRPDRPTDVYAGPDCARDRRGRVLRPFNYLLLRPRADALEVTVRGFCRRDAAIDVIESFEIPRLPDSP